MLGDISRIIYLDMVDYYLNNREIEFNEKKDLLKKFQSVISVDYLTRLFLAYGMNAIKEVDSSLNIDQKALEFMCHFPFELTMVQLCKSFDDKIEKEEKAELESMIDKKKFLMRLWMSLKKLIILILTTCLVLLLLLNAEGLRDFLQSLNVTALKSHIMKHLQKLRILHLIMF